LPVHGGGPGKERFYRLVLIEEKGPGGPLVRDEGRRKESRQIAHKKKSPCAARGLRKRKRRLSNPTVSTTGGGKKRGEKIVFVDELRESWRMGSGEKVQMLSKSHKETVVDLPKKRRMMPLKGKTTQGKRKNSISADKEEETTGHQRGVKKQGCPPLINEEKKNLLYKPQNAEPSRSSARKGKQLAQGGGGGETRRKRKGA